MNTTTSKPGRPKQNVTRGNFNLKVDIRAIDEFKRRADVKGMTQARFFLSQFMPKKEI